MVERELAELAMASSPRSAPEFVDVLGGFIEHSTGANRVHTSARLALFMEAGLNAPLAEAISRGRAAMESWLVPVLARLGAGHPQVAADAVAACVEGLLLHRITRHDDSDPRPPLTLVVDAALASGSAH